MKKEKSLAKGQKSSHLGYLLLSAILVTLGVLLLVYPTESAKTVGYMIAGAAFLFGLLALVHSLNGLEPTSHSHGNFRVFRRHSP